LVELAVPSERPYNVHPLNPSEKIMRAFAALSLAFGLTQGLMAYGVSPNQYTQGQAQDQQQQPAFSQPGGPQPNPYMAPAPGQPPIQIPPQQAAPAAPQNFDAFVPDDWAKAWKHYHWTEAIRMWETKQALFVDARAKVEYDQGHIPGAIPMPLGEFDIYYKKYEAKIKAAKYIITYCHGVGCKLSDKVAQKLYNDANDKVMAGKGHKNTGAFFGGWPQWQEHHMPVETGGVPKNR
jgi:rhodanese-related sulfurtransferase